MTFEELYDKLKEYFETKDYAGFGQGTFSYEFDVTGQGEGRFYLEVRDGVMDIQPFDYKNSLCSFSVDSGNLNRILSRSMSAVEAYSTGRLRVHGDVSAAFRLADALEIA